MTHSPQRVPQATSFLAVASTSSNLHEQRLRQSSSVTDAKRGVRTSIIDAGWDLPLDGIVEGQSEAPPIHARAPRTSIIDTQWDEPPQSRVANRSGPHRIDARAPRTSLIDAEWDEPVMNPVSEQSETSRGPVRRRLLALVDTDEELDPVITWFELDGPECLGLLEGELE